MQPTFAARDMTMLGPLAIALRSADRFAVGFGGSQLTVRGRPVLMDGGSCGTRIVILLNAAPVLEGAGLPPGSRRFEHLRIRAGGVELEPSGTIDVVASETGMTHKPDRDQNRGLDLERRTGRNPRNGHQCGNTC